MNALLNLGQQVSAFIIGPFGIIAITVAIAMAAIGWVFEWCRAARIEQAIVGGAIVFSAGFIVNTWLSHG